MDNYPAVLRNYLFLMGVFSTLPNDSEAFSEGSIGEFLYVNFMMNEFSYLNITSVGRNLIQEEDDCAFACLKIPSCFSYNMATFPDVNGKFLCELLASDKYNNSDKFITSKEFHHFHIPNICDTHPCLNNGKCYFKYTDKRYGCVCASGYTGENCEKDIDECDDGVHDCLPSLASCVNTLGSFNCSCNHGYIGDGKTNCTVNSSECYNFTSLTDADRKPSFHVVEPAKKDTNLGPGWFRFQGDAGNMMTTSCPSIRKCNTHATGWLNGTHPDVADGIVTRQVCFSYIAGCCEWQTQIQVRNCSEYIVYYLHSTPNPGGSLRYCGSD
ncbi:unnamed protein product [Porites lobata]|uniref:EGF-like domain-containing protein n=1 Tax=Porites lobata TaxID=104759 RepID=A0ABN8Q650_9CNID|nr:unnamed protein product [Porites lobata]